LAKKPNVEGHWAFIFGCEKMAASSRGTQKFTSGQHVGVLVSEEEIIQREKLGFTRWYCVCEMIVSWHDGSYFNCACGII